MLTIYPTDTVWGLGAPVFSEEENRRVRHIKGNAEDKPLSVLFYDLDHLREHIALPLEWEDGRLDAFFAKEGTLAIPRDEKKEAPWAGWIYGKSSFATVRCLPLDFVRREGVPFSTTSLNYQGEPPIADITKARAFAEVLEHPHRLIEDGTVTPSGRASTIVAVSPQGKVECWREGRFVREIMGLFQRV